MSLTRGASMQQRMLEAIRRHFRDYGASPSHTELGLALGISRTEVWRPLRALERAGAITLQRGIARSIMLVDRAAMLSNSELARAVMARGGRVTWPDEIGAALAEAYAPMTEPGCSLPSDDLLAQIDRADRGSGERHGAGSEDGRGSDGVRPPQGPDPREAGQGAQARAA